MAWSKFMLAVLLAVVAAGTCDDKKTIINKIQLKQFQQFKPRATRYVTVNIPEVGKVRGHLLRTFWSRKLVFQFLDVKYGEAPSGELRFKPSIPAKPWKETRNAFVSRRGCPSLQDLAFVKSAEKKNRNVEDCLFLSINTKSFKKRLPVMVYVHGDFLYEGSSVEAPPGYLLEEDVVLVSVRYRLGPFGFLSSMTEGIPGNAAVSDVILALKWIQKNIEKFGGDPSRVTLFGQVGGAALINVLTMSPAVPEGLFHRVIYQSGSALSPAFITDDPLHATKDIARYAGCKGLQNVETLNSCLKSVNASKLLEAFSVHGNVNANLGVGSYGGIQFTIGGPSEILPEHPGKLLASEAVRYYPTMGGSVKNAGTFVLKDIFVDNFNETIPDDVFDGMGYINHIIAQTNGADPTSAWRKFAETEFFSKDEIQHGTFYNMIPGLIDMCGTIPFKNPVLLALQANAKHLPNSTYLYSFDYVGEFNRYQTKEDEDPDMMPFDLGVSLTDENLYLFPWPWYAVLTHNRDQKIAKRMVALWASFATNGKPSAPGLPEWPPMTDDTGPYLKLGKVVSVGENFLDEYSITVNEVKMGYNLVNEEFFDNLEEVDTTTATVEPVDEAQEEEEEEVDESDVQNEQQSPAKGQKKKKKKNENENESENQATSKNRAFLWSLTDDDEAKRSL